ncbi:MAG: hypothetical protein KDA60_03230 [Planctomycetales bacterium]|nr:hypothetical protein [Planctomycetales bacterium]
MCHAPTRRGTDSIDFILTLASTLDGKNRLFRYNQAEVSLAAKPWRGQAEQQWDSGLRFGAAIRTDESYGRVERHNGSIW